jgi:hypothetical protein
LVQPADEAVVERVVEHVFDRGRVLLLRFDQLRPEAPAEDVVASSVALVEGPRVAAVQVAHAVREVRFRRLDDQVVVVAHQAADVDPPLVPLHDPVEDLEEDDAVAVVQHDRCVVVAARRDVVKRAGCEVSPWAGHRPDGSPDEVRRPRLRHFRHRSGVAPSRARHRTGHGG